MNPGLYREGITSLKNVRRLKSKDKFCETTVAWKQTHFLYVKRWQIVHRGDVTISLYSSG